MIQDGSGSTRRRMRKGEEDGGWRTGADLTPEMLKCLPAWPIVPSSAVFPSIITACYPS